MVLLRASHVVLRWSLNTGARCVGITIILTSWRHNIWKGWRLMGFPIFVPGHIVMTISRLLIRAVLAIRFMNKGSLLLVFISVFSFSYVLATILYILPIVYLSPNLSPRS